MSAWSDHLRDFIVSPPEKRGAVARYARYVWSQKCTGTGRVLLGVFLFASLGASLVGNNYPLYIFGLFLMSFMFMARVTGLWFRPRVRLTRQLPARCAAGATVTVQAAVTNTARNALYDLTVGEKLPPRHVTLEEQPEYLDCLDPGQTARLTYRLTPQRRGSYEFIGPTAFSCYPFGIYHAVREVEEPQRVLVYPRFARLSAIDLPAGRKHQPGGLQLVSQTGDSEEFIGNRPYRPGDRLRDLDHRAWARLGGPVVREYEQEYLCRIALVVDTYLPRAGRHVRDLAGAAREDPGGMGRAFLDRGLDLFDFGRREARADMEAAISLCAGVAEVLSRQEYVVDLFAAGPELYHFQAGRSLAYLDNILDVLACIEPCHDDPLARITPALLEEVSEISTAVVILLDWDTARERFVRALQRCGVAVKLIVVSSPEPEQDPRVFVSEAGPGQRFAAAEVFEGVERL